MLATEVQKKPLVGKVNDNFLLKTIIKLSVSFEIMKPELCLPGFEVIYKTRETVFHWNIQTTRRELKIRRAAGYLTKFEVFG